jgi:hypothetical protein
MHKYSCCVKKNLIGPLLGEMLLEHHQIEALENTLIEAAYKMNILLIRCGQWRKLNNDKGKTIIAVWRRQRQKGILVWRSSEVNIRKAHWGAVGSDAKNVVI